jgi:hypothetical protein
MRLWVKVVLGTLVVIVAIVVGGYHFVYGVMCGSDEMHRLRSPDGRYDAVVYEFDCGATTGFATHIAIVRSGLSVPNHPGNVTIMDGIVKVQLQWHGRDSLTLSYDDRAEVIGKPNEVRGVRIVYQALNGSGL